MTAGILNKSIIFEGNLDFKKNSFVLTEKINTNSVSTLPINQLVCSMPGPLVENTAKNNKSNTVLIIPKREVIKANSFISNFGGFLSSASSTLSLAIEIIGKSLSKFNKSI